MIELSDVRKRYRVGESVVNALDGISLEIGAGEYVAVTGPSGSGKSTLLNILGCLERPDEGGYRLAGREVSRLSADELATVRNRRIGFVFQIYNLLPRMTALENVELPLLYAGCRDARPRALAALERVGLADRVAHDPSQLSGGQRQRVAVARAIVTAPDVLFADEPTGALDSRTGLEIMELFESLHAEGRTVIVVTHEESIARRAARRIRLRDGAIEEAA